MTWKIVKIEDIAAKTKYPIGDGDHGAIKPAMYQKEGVPYIRVGDIDWNGNISEKVMVYISEEINNLNPKSHLFPGDIVIAKTGATIGKVAIIPDHFKIANTTSSIGKITVDTKIAEPKYVLKYLQTQEFKKQMWAVSIKSAQPGFNIINLKKFTIPLPSLSEQKHIAEVLSKAEALIAERKQSIQLLDEYLKSTFLEMFGDLKGVKTSLSEICEVNPKKSEIASLSKETLVSFIPMASVSENGLVDLSQTKKIDEVWSGFTYFREDDVTFAKITPCMENGKGAIMRGLKNDIGFGTTEFHVLRPIEKLSTSEYIYHLTMQHNFRKEAEKNMTGSAGQKRVPTDFFKKYKLVAPPLKLQTQFATIVEKTEALKAQYKEHLQNLEQMYGALSQRAFRGELNKTEIKRKEKV